MTFKQINSKLKKNFLLWLLEFSIPSSHWGCVNAVYNIVDRIFIGNAPVDWLFGLAAASITYPITLVMMAFGLFSGVRWQQPSFFLSIWVLEKKTHQKKHTLFRNGCCFAIIAGFIVLLYRKYFLKNQSLRKHWWAVKLFMPYATEYLSIILFGAVFQLSGNDYEITLLEQMAILVISMI